MAPTRLGIGRITKVGLVIVVVLGALLGLSLAVPPQTNSQPSSSTPLKIVVERVTADPVEASEGHTILIYDLTITNTDTISHLVSAFGFQLVTANNSVYSLSFAIAVRRLLPSVTLEPQQHASGQVSFEVPNGELPSRLEFGIGPQAVVSSLPQPSAWVSRILDADVKFVGAVTGFPLVAFASVQNSTSYFYTGDVVSLQLALSYYGSGSTVKVTSVALMDSGFNVIQTAPPLPITVNGGDKEVDLVVYVSVPQSVLNGTSLHLQVTTST